MYNTVIHGGKSLSALLMCLLVGCSLSPLPSSTTPAAVPTPSSTVKPSARPLALVYRGPAGCPGCSEALAALLASSKWHFIVDYVGPNEALQLSQATLKKATLYAQPGGNGTVDTAFAVMQNYTHMIRNFIKSGGRYLGTCMGGYLAGKDPGFNLLPGDSDEFITSPKASVTTDADTIVKVLWRGKPRYMYFQDGPYFIVHHSARNVTVLANYTNGEIAALVAPYGKGKVGVSGPHPEATTSWYTQYNLPEPAGLDADLGHDLIDTLMGT
jgi:glutamine amidotransferase-like uncharacterized protein